MAFPGESSQYGEQAANHRDLKPCKLRNGPPAPAGSSPNQVYSAWRTKHQREIKLLSSAERKELWRRQRQTLLEGRARTYRCKFQQQIFQLDIKEKGFHTGLVKHWSIWLKKAVKSPPAQVFQNSAGLGPEQHDVVLKSDLL